MRMVGTLTDVPNPRVSEHDLDAAMRRELDDDIHPTTTVRTVRIFGPLDPERPAEELALRLGRNEHVGRSLVHLEIALVEANLRAPDANLVLPVVKVELEPQRLVLFQRGEVLDRVPPDDRTVGLRRDAGGNRSSRQRPARDADELSTRERRPCVAATILVVAKEQLEQSVPWRSPRQCRELEFEQEDHRPMALLTGWLCLAREHQGR